MVFGNVRITQVRESVKAIEIMLCPGLVKEEKYAYRTN